MPKAGQVMIFRRFLQRFRQQQWGAIATELAIVIIGVFIGMQVSNWNAERETNQKAKVFTARLSDDLRKEAWGYEWLINYSHETNVNQRRVLDAMAGEITLSDEQFVISAYRATQYKENSPYRATYDELVSTGTIGLIANQEMRETAINIFAAPWLDQIARQARDSEYRKLFRETVPAGIQEALLARCGDRFATVLDYATIEASLDYPCTLDQPAEKIRAAADALRALPRFVPALRIRFADNQTAIADLQTGNSSSLKNLQAIRNAKP
ncbi:MAG TPA: hypothetical protein VFN25_05290 [Dokdonella sp.]|uniref:hypothetical protein n=1 Tax=Dokdonella sp. TaxID=2291710 RepID=UPI002D7F4E79|nr:hypothetical protein [Dokdonella sp.]HET9032304.1 hypothetical protein [Dokdonella sp.]